MSNRAPLNLDTHAVFPVINAMGLNRIISAVGRPLANRITETTLQGWLEDIAATTIHILLSPNPAGKAEEYIKLLALLEDYERRASDLAKTSLPPPRLPDRWLTAARVSLLAATKKGGGPWKHRHSEYFFPRMAGLLAAAYCVEPTPTTSAAGTREGNAGARGGDFARFVQATQQEMLRYVEGFDADAQHHDVKSLLSHWSRPEPKTLEKKLEDALKIPLHREKIHLDWPRPPDLRASPTFQWESYRDMYLELAGHYEYPPK